MPVQPLSTHLASLLVCCLLQYLRRCQTFFIQQWCLSGNDGTIRPFALTMLVLTSTVVVLVTVQPWFGSCGHGLEIPHRCPSVSTRCLCFYLPDSQVVSVLITPIMGPKTIILVVVMATSCICLSCSNSPWLFTDISPCSGCVSILWLVMGHMLGIAFNQGQTVIPHHLLVCFSPLSSAAGQGSG